MEFISAKCPKCGGELMLPKDRNDVICTYCGSTFFLSDALAKQQNPSLTTLFQLANNGMRGGNYTEAYDYFTRIVEIDPDNSDAWIGKGISAGWLSTLGKPRISEMVSAISQGLEFVSPEKTENYKINLSDLVTNISKSFYVLAYRHMKENLSLGSSIFNEFAFHVQTASDGIFLQCSLIPKIKMLFYWESILPKPFVKGKTSRITKVITSLFI
jgi:tetratricopeptide (TPR) repeat protein